MERVKGSALTRASTRTDSGSETGLLSGAVLHAGTESELRCEGYHQSRLLLFLFYLGVVLSAGSLWLVSYWWPVVRVRLTCKKRRISGASFVVASDLFGQQFVVAVFHDTIYDVPYEFRSLYSINEEASAITQQSYKLVHFTLNHDHYVWSSSQRSFILLSGLENGSVTESLTGVQLTEPQRVTRQELFGLNAIILESPNILNLLLKEVLNPFYVFQVFSIVLWSFDQYVLFASCIGFISLVSIAVSLYETRRQRIALKDLVETGCPQTATVKMGEESVTVAADTLVPGDILIIPPGGCIVPCDAVLLTGNAVMNESMLTGESVPVTKTPLAPGEQINAAVLKRHTIFAGTTVLQTRYFGDSFVTALIIRTGFNTAKGELVKSILHPKQVDFKFYRDATRFLLAMGVMASFGMLYTIIDLAEKGVNASEITKRALDIVTVVVPPSLPATMTAGIIYSQQRLKKHLIFCISPSRINIAGRIDLFAFDKTGTLTEDGLTVVGVSAVEGSSLTSVTQHPKELSLPLKTVLATCHSLSTIDGELRGDPLDLEMFTWSGWTLEEPDEGYDTLTPPVVRSEHGTEIALLRQLPFTSALQYMSVVVRSLEEDNNWLVTKGAPEKVLGLCRSDTVPDNFYDALHVHTRSGARVIALAYRELGESWHQLVKLSSQTQVERGELERGLTLLGLLVLENKVKEQSEPVIAELRLANVRCIMITGDNLLTALSVARQCGFVGRDQTCNSFTVAPAGDCLQRDLITGEDAGEVADYFIETEPRGVALVLDGHAFEFARKFEPEVLRCVLLRGVIFARMSPDQKQTLIELLQGYDYITGMCGDGANDCGALKAAHAGISLSDAEASIAAPFTSKVADISCVPTLVKEGRCALMTAYATFKYMAMYSFIQFVSVTMLYSLNGNLSDFMFLYIDLVITLTVAFLMGLNGPSSTLYYRRPSGVLLSVDTLLSIVLQVVVQAGFQIGTYLLLQSQDWYLPCVIQPGNEFKPFCAASATLFFISSFQYLTMSLVYSPGPPHRKPLYTNYAFLAALLVLTSLTFCLTMWDLPGLTKWLQVYSMPASWRLVIVLIPACNSCVSFILESVLEQCRHRAEEKSSYRLALQRDECEGAALQASATKLSRNGNSC